MKPLFLHIFLFVEITSAAVVTYRLKGKNTINPTFNFVAKNNRFERVKVFTHLLKFLLNGIEPSLKDQPTTVSGFVHELNRLLAKVKITHFNYLISGESFCKEVASFGQSSFGSLKRNDSCQSGRAF